ncbi:2-C-methyl-D-erythritol 4-phosphate cytidylyltransferase, putative [Plasmodium berghei]|uniref:2-C-methyl-D-erythritol 4-phosphate cytidylyltransferase, putative n=2 Tax=Plasmodium berghei TaxID=5821 RepID=A0A509AEN7_PLABA|nr:2-C-methyl-D-erythritol 4-phosphate cytidylyltransferase, putative [Plasmodium berghei ANKA]CXH87281.1 2-C-methyl-D-erythritol 4-phosphate cytidylyltransferase, putative [Plasmodium berghei]SCL90081.1 2-C-methyl-D-erythritol 4-phosphate cytidylyltransferase, putative [Plasmodium berghei]SCM15214.1 2-C-methyl-D-erythritol 4-phosphate cytidylyltransferase, putative [Plasmodium berghei]SCM17009.1 2-C-methyl-D-erythritol 4-phosphate cytidylyltransferase, putative [Plasmodium berghei]SCN21860.1 |eukprot:XP_034419790.1 2-C-methyl-D-erythritol 4-phosphate cytidylyltransferase, putative [Plasmodium berghei ANKA]
MNILWAALSYIFFNYYIFKGRYYFVYSLKIYNFQKDKIIKQKGINLDNRPLYRNGKFVCTQNNIKDNKLYKKKQEQKKKILQFIYTNFKSNKKDDNIFQKNMSPLLNYYIKSTNITNQWCCIKSIYNDENNGEYINVNNLNTIKNFDTKEIKKYEKNINKKNIHSIFLCGGVGKRTELASRKQFLHLDNIPIFIYSFNLFIKCNYIKSISLVCDSTFFPHVVENINIYNSLLLKKKVKNNFLKIINDNILEKENNLTGINTQHKEDNINSLNSNNKKIEQNKITILNYIKENKYIIYDNEKNKCIFEMEEILNNLKEKNPNNKKHKIKPKDIDTNRYKLITIIDSGNERIDSFLNALKSLNIYENNQEYIYKVLENYLKKNPHLNSKFNIEFDYTYLLKKENKLKKENDKNFVKKKKKYITDILVHDAARPFLSEFDFFNLIYQSSLGKNVILGTKATDTIKLLNNNKQEKDGCNLIKKNIDRKVIFQAQTPQIFESKTLLKILQYFVFPSNYITTNSNTLLNENKKLQNTSQFTDTSSIVQHFTKNKITTLQATFPNFKITTPADVFQSFFFMKYIYNNNNASNDIYRSLFKDEYINSDSSYILTNQFNNFFFYNSLNKKQKILYQRFYYRNTCNGALCPI